MKCKVCPRRIPKWRLKQWPHVKTCSHDCSVEHQRRLRNKASAAYNAKQRENRTEPTSGMGRPIGSEDSYERTRKAQAESAPQAPPSETATCSTAGCDRPIRARGLCGKHYNAWYRGEEERKRTQEKAGTP